MNKKFYINSSVAIISSLLIISSATAVPYTNLDSLKRIEIFDNIQIIIKSKQFNNLKNIAEKNIDIDTRCEIRNNVKNLLINKGIQKLSYQFEILVEFLVAIAEVLLFLFGYNPIGESITIAIVGLLALISMIIVALPYTPLLILALTHDALLDNQVILESIIQKIGLLGFALLFLLLLPIYVVIAALSIVPMYFFIVISETLLIIDDVLSRV